ncbi:MAG TPA: PTS system mannose/fructose/sorbose family transporter subunit IID [Gemmatimonadales bacterium]
MAEVKAMPGFGRVLARLFALQAAWNYERMQGIGFGYAAEPALRGLAGGKDGAPYRAALARQSRFFNAHPYFAGLAVGASVRAEIDGESPERVERLREALCGPLGSIGDRLFWAAWLPACSAAAVIAIAFGARAWAAVLFLLLYNAMHLACRVWALRAGWERGMQVASALGTPALRAIGRGAAPLAGLLVGAAVPLSLAWQLHGAGDRAVLAALGGALLIALLLKLVKPAGGVLVPAAVLGMTWLAGLIAW